MDESDASLEALVSAVRSSRKYRHICVEVMRRVGARELASRQSLREAVRATKRKLHQVGAAYLSRRMAYARWLDELREAVDARGQEGLREACVGIMAYHASTRERLSILGSFLRQTLEELAPIRSVMDVGCGLHPLAIPWIPLHEEATYWAYDMYEDLIEFVRGFLALVGVRGGAEARDVLVSLPAREADLAFFLKTLPCLEQLEPGAGLRLVETIPARYLLVSFPVASLGGKGKGMLANYEARFRELTRGKDWQVERFVFDTELVFLVRK